jgi:hypothetical protein
MDQGQQLAPGTGGAGLIAQVDERIGGLLDAQPLGQRGRQQQARVGDGVGVVNAMSSWSRLWEDCIEKVPSCCGKRQLR